LLGFVLHRWAADADQFSAKDGRRKRKVCGGGGYGASNMLGLNMGLRDKMPS
jgi:hypothetical protein